MKKRWMIILMAVSMAVFGSTAFAGDGVKDKATFQNSTAGAMMLANNSQASPQMVYETLENFGAEQEEMGQGMLLLAAGECEDLCIWYRLYCCPITSESGPSGAYCASIPSYCPCSCD